MVTVKRTIPIFAGAVCIVTLDFDAARLRLKVHKDALEGMRPALNAVANILRADVRRAFREAGPGWKPLAASTIAEKEALGLPARNASGRIPYRLKQNGQFSAGNILIRSGRLRDAWGRKDSPDHFEKIDEKAGTIEMGPDPDRVPYAAIHQDGCDGYKILAKAGKALAFTGRSGERVVRREVDHPGLVARPVTVRPDAVRIAALTVEAHLHGEKLNDVEAA